MIRIDVIKFLQSMAVLTITIIVVQYFNLGINWAVSIGYFIGAFMQGSK